MSDERPPEGAASAEQLLADMSEFLKDTFEELKDLYRSTYTNSPPTEKDLAKKGVEFREWAKLALQERQRLNELHGKHSQDGGGAVIDFAGARAEIGRRLDRIRAARGAGGVSG